MERLGSNAEFLRKRISGESEKEATLSFCILSGICIPAITIIGKYPGFVKRNRAEIFRFLHDPNANKNTNVADQYFLVESELLKRSSRSIKPTESILPVPQDVNENLTVPKKVKILFPNICNIEKNWHRNIAVTLRTSSQKTL